MRHTIMGTPSHPLEVVVGQGQKAKHVQDCTELFLANQGITQLAGFERLVNLEILWVNNNKLLAIDNLDKNIRVKQLYAHDNRICTLKGSLLHFKFLTHLDLSNNQLRDLAKLLKPLCKMRFLQELNLQGNPCCEEPDYRMAVIHAVPSLQVLDHHQVTTEERLKAAAFVCDSTSATVPASIAFGSKVPDSAMQQATASLGSNGRSALELEVDQAAQLLRARRQQEADAAEQALYNSNPYADYWAPQSTLPPPPGMIAAQQAWNQRAADCSISMMQGTRGHACDSSTSSSTGLGALKMLSSGTMAGIGADGIQSGPGVVSIPAPADMGYILKDVVLIHRPQQIRNDHDGKSPHSGSNSREDRSSATGHYGGTFRQHLTKKQWQMTDNRLCL